MATQTLAPDAIISQSGWLSCSLSDVTSDPSSPDAYYCIVPNNSASTTLRVSFGTPNFPPSIGAGLQKFRVEYARIGDIGAAHPSIRIALRETAGGTDLASSTVNAANDLLSHVMEFTWNASLLGTSNGSAVQCMVTVTGVEDFDPDHFTTVEIGGISWVEEYAGTVNASAAVTVAKPGPVSLAATYTAPVPQFNASSAITIPKPGPVSLTATRTVPQYAVSSAITIAQRPSPHVAAFFQPVTGATAWISPAVPIDNYGDSGVLVSNTSNMAAQTEAFANASLNRTGGSTVQETQSLIWDWVDPADYPAGAILNGIEVVIYCQYSTTNDSTHSIWPYHLYLGTAGVAEASNITDHQIPKNLETSPLYRKALYWGGKTDLLGVSAGTLVTDFLAQNVPTYGKAARLKIRNNSGSGDASATVKIAYAMMKLWWSVPNYVDMAATPSFDVTASDSTAPLQKIRDLSSSMSAGASITPPAAIGVPITMYATPNFSVSINPPTISEGATYIDMACYMNIGSAFSADVTKIRDMFSNAAFGVTQVASVGYSNLLGADWLVSVTMDPQLYRYVELQTDAIGSWFTVSMDPDGLIGDMVLTANFTPIVTMTASMLVNWALYAAATIGVTATPTLGKMTNLSTDMRASVTAVAQVVADINMASAMPMNGLLFNSAFVRLPVPAPEERTMYIPIKNRKMNIQAKGRVITLTSN